MRPMGAKFAGDLSRLIRFFRLFPKEATASIAKGAAAPKKRGVFTLVRFDENALVATAEVNASLTRSPSRTERQRAVSLNILHPKDSRQTLRLHPVRNCPFCIVPRHAVFSCKTGIPIHPSGQNSSHQSRLLRAPKKHPVTRKFPKSEFPI
jgi:hypothetical protein